VKNIEKIQFSKCLLDNGSGQLSATIFTKDGDMIFLRRALVDWIRDTEHLQSSFRGAFLIAKVFKDKEFTVRLGFAATGNHDTLEEMFVVVEGKKAEKFIEKLEFVG
jgi:hypothetical protein